MFIEFVKEHPAGIAKGQCCKVKENDGKRFVKEEFAREISEEDFNSFKEGLKSKKEKESNNVLIQEVKELKEEKPKKSKKKK
jgi:hypothetical protein